jgi:hypothetical protein
VNEAPDPLEAGGVSNQGTRKEPDSGGASQGTMGTGKTAGSMKVEGAMGSNQRTSDGEGNAA